MKKEIKIICTLGPTTLNKEFLRFAKNKISLLRLNMSHLSLNNLEKKIKFIKKHTNIPICIDTEGAQIRTKVKNEKLLKKGQKVKIGQQENNLILYPSSIYTQIKVNDILNVGFSNLKLKVIKKKNYILCKVLSSGKLENNKGVHVENRKVILNYLTKKDFEAIKMGKKYNISNYALSFTNSTNDIIKFNNLLKRENKIFKVETLQAIKNFKSFLKMGDRFLIDRGDLSKDVRLENIPIIQRNLFKIRNKRKNKKIFVATNLLESMLENNYPTRGEANDIYNSLEIGADGLVLAAETAIGKHPQDTVLFLERMIKVFKKEKH
jgi:pyruvate kinase|tara:strand:+ start:289 stop:1254 length:966 start_codon:yes stop_codon:yes gene_type:complete